jgi:hypothetical protein
MNGRSNQVRRPAFDDGDGAPRDLFDRQRFTRTLELNGDVSR